MSILVWKIRRGTQNLIVTTGWWISGGWSSTQTVKHDSKQYMHICLAIALKLDVGNSVWVMEVQKDIYLANTPLRIVQCEVLQCQSGHNMSQRSDVIFGTSDCMILFQTYIKVCSTCFYSNQMTRLDFKGRFSPHSTKKAVKGIFDSGPEHGSNKWSWCINSGTVKSLNHLVILDCCDWFQMTNDKLTLWEAKIIYSCNCSSPETTSRLSLLN